MYIQPRGAYDGTTKYQLKERIMQYDFIDKYNELRDTISLMCDANPELIMGNDAWLVHAMGQSDMTLYDHQDFIGVSGTTYTSQTMSHEWFEFMIPKADIELFQIKQLLNVKW